jgi:hypothetical protein
MAAISFSVYFPLSSVVTMYIQVMLHR